MKPDHAFSLIFQLYNAQFLKLSVAKGLINDKSLALAGDGTPVRTSSLLRSKRLCNCRDKGILDCRCKRKFSQPDTNSGWDSSRECYFNGYHLFMFVASDSHSDLPIFPLLEQASRHDMLSFLHTFFTMKAYLPEFRIQKLLLDSAMDAIPVYEYCKREGIVPFIDLKKTNNGNYRYKDTFTIKLYPLSRTFSNLSTLIFRRDFSGVPHLIDMLFLQIQQSGRIGYKYP